jgi:N6-adenosine-specific RNA methylase IME4
MFPETAKIELFGRRKLPGWDVIGNAIDGIDIRDRLLDISMK